MSVNDVLAMARRDLGIAESPANSNHSVITEWYNKNVENLGYSWPGCEAGVTKWMWTGGAKSLKVGRAYTVWGANDFIRGANGGTWHWGTAGIQPGDQIYFDWLGGKGSTAVIDHTGIVESVSGGYIYTIENNTRYNDCRRMQRDAKYVVGYGRPAWSRLTPSTPAPAPAQPPASAIPPKLPASKRNAALVMRIQRSLEITADGQWGKVTDEWANRMRTAARAKHGYPVNVPRNFHVGLVQQVIDTTPDKIWGPKSQAALVKWIVEFQKALGVEADGWWGPGTDRAYATARNNNRLA